MAHSSGRSMRRDLPAANALAQMSPRREAHPPADAGGSPRQGRCRTRAMDQGRRTPGVSRGVGWHLPDDFDRGPGEPEFSVDGVALFLLRLERLLVPAVRRAAEELVL